MPQRALVQTVHPVLLPCVARLLPTRLRTRPDGGGLVVSAESEGGSYDTIGETLDSGVSEPCRVSTTV